MDYSLVLGIWQFLILLYIFMSYFPFSIYFWVKNICVFRKKAHSNMVRKWKELFVCLFEKNKQYPCHITKYSAIATKICRWYCSCIQVYFLPASLWFSVGLPLTTLFYPVSEDNYETKIIRAGANKRRKRVVLCLDLFEPFCKTYNEEMTDTCIPWVTVPTLGNMNPFQFLFEKDSQSSIKDCLQHNMRKWQVTGQILSLYFIAWSKTWRFCCLLRNGLELFRQYVEGPFHSFICCWYVILYLYAHRANIAFVCPGLTR